MVFLCVGGEDRPWGTSGWPHLQTCNNMVQLAPWQSSRWPNGSRTKRASDSDVLWCVFLHRFCCPFPFPSWLETTQCDDLSCFAPHCGSVVKCNETVLQQNANPLWLDDLREICGGFCLELNGSHPSLADSTSLADSFSRCIFRCLCLGFSGSMWLYLAGCTLPSQLK